MNCQLLLVLAIAISSINCKLITRAFPRTDNQQYEVVNTDGSQDLSSLKDYCGDSIGPNLVYIRNKVTKLPTGKETLNFGYGVINQVSSYAPRRVYAGSTQTNLDQRDYDVIKTMGSYKAILNAITKGKRASRTPQPSRGSMIEKSELAATVRVFELAKNSELHVKGIEWLCDSTTGVCSQTANTYNTPGIFYFVEGVGEHLTIIKTSDLDKFLPTNATHAEKRIIATSIENYLRSGMIMCDPRDFDSLLHRVKKWAGIALAATAIGLVKTLEKAVEKALDSIDKNNLEFQKVFTQQQDYLLDIIDKISINNQQINSFKKQIYISNNLNIGMNDVISGIEEKSENLENFILQAELYRSTVSVMNQELLAKYLDNFHKDYPTEKLMRYRLDESNFYTVSKDGEIFIGNLELQCGEALCYSRKELQQWYMRGKIRTVKSPVLSAISCGVFYESDGVVDNLLEVAENIERVIELLKSKSIKYAYVNQVDCTLNQEMYQSTSYTRLAKRIDELGLSKLIVEADGRFRMNCTIEDYKKAGNKTKYLQKMLEKEPFCYSILGAAELNEVAERVSEQRLNLDMVGDAFRDSMSGENFMMSFMENLGEAGKETLNLLAKIPAAALKALTDHDFDTMENMIYVNLALSIAANLQCIILAFLLWRHRSMVMEKFKKEKAFFPVS